MPWVRRKMPKLGKRCSQGGVDALPRSTAMAENDNGRTRLRRPALPPVCAAGALACWNVGRMQDASLAQIRQIQSGMLSISRVPPIRAATSSLALLASDVLTGSSVAASRSSA